MTTRRFRNQSGVIALVVGLIGSLLLIVGGAASAVTSLSTGAPGKGNWYVLQMWHGSSLGTLVPAGTAIDLKPRPGAPRDVYSVGSGTIVKTSVCKNHATVYVNTVGIGIIGYVHLSSTAVLRSGRVSAGQKLGRIAGVYSETGDKGCTRSWNTPHLHIAFPKRYGTLALGGNTVLRMNQTLNFGGLPTVFSGNVSSSLSLTVASANVTICADNLLGNTVTTRLSRPAANGYSARSWTKSKLASSRCVTFSNMDGDGNTFANVTYTQRSALNSTPSSTWSGSGCFAETGGRGLCDQQRR